MSVLTFGGLDRDGEKFGAFLLDSMAGGGGASIDQDGLDGSGDYDVPRPSIANVEANESASPILYLFRSFVPDTAGPGRMRGGATTGCRADAARRPRLRRARSSATASRCRTRPASSAACPAPAPRTCSAARRKPAGALIGRLYTRPTRSSPIADTDDIGAKPGSLRIESRRRLRLYLPGRRRLWRSAPPRSGARASPTSARLPVAAMGGGALRRRARRRRDAVDGEATEAKRAAIRAERNGGAAPRKEPPRRHDGDRARPFDRRGRPFPLLLRRRSRRRPTPTGRTERRCARSRRKAAVRTSGCTRNWSFARSTARDCATLLELEVCRKDEESLWTMALDL